MMKNSSKLNLGCGLQAKKGWLNVDIVKLKGVDIVLDLEKTPLPFKDNRFDEVESHHVFEHIQNFVPLMEELHRVCKQGAVLNVSVPYFASPAYWLDPTHKRMFNIETFDHAFTGDSYLSKARFKIVKRKLFYFSCRKFMKSRWYSLPFDFLINLAPAIYQRFFVYFLPASEVHFVLVVEKKK